MMEKINWEKENLLWIANDIPEKWDTLDPKYLRSKIEPWLTALFQSEHLSLLAGAGLTYAVHKMATGKTCSGMAGLDFSIFSSEIDKRAKETAKAAGRGDKPNIEDKIRVANEIVAGMEHLGMNNFAKGTKTVKELIEEIDRIIGAFIGDVLSSELNLFNAKGSEKALEYLMSFLISFASRAATRERLNVFTTNYDRYLEFAADIAGIRLLDRFVGTLCPVFRSSRLEVDMHYNPPGIRGEPRYLEGVAHITKLHGSLDWVYYDGYVRRISLPFGSNSIKPFLPQKSAEINGYCPVMIYPNAAKDRETSEYPYVDLFRDFASGICRPNSTLVVYGYSFGDEHINRVIKDMLTIPSSHLVIISFSDEGKRIKNFVEGVHRPAQLSLLIGDHFGDLSTLVDNYLPKSAIDRTSIRMTELLRSRGVLPKGDNKENDKKDGALI